MATYDNEEPRKGAMYVYIMDTPTKLKKTTPELWRHVTRSRTYLEEIDYRHDDDGVEERKIVVDHGRKSPPSSGTSSRRSVSQIEGMKRVEGRKSVCGIGELALRRKSVSNIVEVVNVASMEAFFGVKVLVRDMPGFMQVHAFKCARKSFDSCKKISSRDMACTMKKEFDKVYGPAWHCIIGSSFGSYVTHSTGCFLYFSMEKLYILLFKTKLQKASE